MAEEKEKKVKVLNFRDMSTCEATIQMLEKAAKDGVETAFSRAADMKACPIGADSACCKHCFMGPCRLNARDPYSKVGVCGATIDTIQARNFARFVASGCAAHTDHGMSMLDLFREVVNGHIKDYTIKNPEKLKAVAESTAFLDPAQKPANNRAAYLDPIPYIRALPLKPGWVDAEEAADEEHPGERQHPEAERVEAREGHVGRANHQR